MATTIQNVDHIRIQENFVQDGLDYLPESLKKGNIQSIINIDLQRWKLLEGILYDLAINRLLSNATGIYLDDIGARYQIYRNGLDDDNYRATLFLRTGEAIANLMPLVTDLRVVDGLGVPFVFDGDESGEGFGFSDDTSGPSKGGRFYFSSYYSTYDI